MPLIVCWDGIVSMLRIYSPEQMKELREDLQAPDYSWEIGRIRARGIPGGLPYLIGRPIPQEQEPFCSSWRIARRFSGCGLGVVVCGRLRARDYPALAVPGTARWQHCILAGVC